MAFFSKLRERLTRSSSKIGEGLDGIVSEAPEATPAPVEAPAPGLVGRLFGRAPERVEEPRRVLDDAMLEEMEDLLVRLGHGRGHGAAGHRQPRRGADGPPPVRAPRSRAAGGRGRADHGGRGAPHAALPKKPQVVLVVGVNGSGKTTTIGKLASQFRAAGKTVVIAAGDTFRAAAVEQLQVWGQRAGVPVMTARRRARTRPALPSTRWSGPRRRARTCC